MGAGGGFAGRYPQAWRNLQQNVQTAHPASGAGAPPGEPDNMNYGQQGNYNTLAQDMSRNVMGNYGFGNDRFNYRPYGNPYGGMMGGGGGYWQPPQNQGWLPQQQQQQQMGGGYQPPHMQYGGGGFGGRYGGYGGMPGMMGGMGGWGQRPWMPQVYGGGGMGGGFDPRDPRSQNPMVGGIVGPNHWSQQQGMMNDYQRRMQQYAGPQPGGWGLGKPGYPPPPPQTGGGFQGRPMQRAMM